MFEIISFKILKNLSYNFILACNSWSKTIRYRFCRFVCKHQVHSLCPQKKSTTKPMSNKKTKKHFATYKWDSSKMFYLSAPHQNAFPFVALTLVASNLTRSPPNKFTNNQNRQFQASA